MYKILHAKAIKGDHQFILLLMRGKTFLAEICGVKRKRVFV
jgi:hypothetical protein